MTKLSELVGDFMIPSDWMDQITPLLPRSARRGGRNPTVSDHKVLSAIFYVLIAGCMWRKLPKSYGNWHTIYTRFKRWCEVGVFHKLLQTMLSKKMIRLDLVALDSTTVRAHPCAS